VRSLPPILSSAGKKSILKKRAFPLHVEPGHGDLTGSRGKRVWYLGGKGNAYGAFPRGRREGKGSLGGGGGTTLAHCFTVDGGGRHISEAILFVSAWEKRL